MPLLQWNDRFELGIVEIDQQHKELIELINRIYDEFKGGAPVPALKGLLEVLIRDAQHHFECEEQWMKETSYVRILDHVQEHSKFHLRVGEIDNLLGQGLDTSLDLMLFLNNWIRHHLMEVDAEFADHIIELNKRGGATVRSELPFHLKVKKYLSS
jgi:hemerythrin